MQQKIVTYRLEGMSNKEIAGHMAISKKTVENQVNRAIKEIKKQAKISSMLLVVLLEGV
jgi:RNA polymerase sigma-70 factor (ECF subfamily)